jgi:hypothetical protein
LELKDNADLKNLTNRFEILKNSKNFDNEKKKLHYEKLIVNINMKQ